MNLAQVSRWRNLAGKAGGFLCFLALLLLLDGIIAGFREPPAVFKVLPGTSTGINGPLAEEVQSVQDLMYTSDTEHLRVVFEALHQGYFLGGDMWRGQLVVSPQAQPGEYRLTVTPKNSKAVTSTPAFRIFIYPDELSRQQSLKSFVRRYTGISPYGVAGALVPAILLAFGLVYYLSGQQEGLLARTGRAEIYRVQRQDGDCAIHFALGTADGLSPGTQVTIVNGEGQVMGRARVVESSQTDSVAMVTSDQEIQAGYLVSRGGA